jgi:Na+/melibiose symporter-like transporter
LGIILATLLSIGLGIGGSILYDINIAYPFLLALVVTGVLLALGVFLIKEPRPEASGMDASEEGVSGAGGIRRTLDILKRFPEENKRSVLFMAVNIFLGAFGFSLIQAFLSSYNMTVLGQEQSKAGLPFLIAGGTVMIVAFPAALLAGRIGRRRTMLIGCAGWAAAALAIFLIRSPGLFIPLMVVTAAFYGLWYVNSFVGLIDAAPDDKTIGTMTALTSIANMVGMSVGPALAGVLIESTGYNYAMIFPLQAVVSVLAFLALLPVTKCEAREVPGAVQEGAAPAAAGPAV